MVEKLHHTEIPLGPPPGRSIGKAEHHWVEKLDYDGRPCGLEVYQWQPNAKAWCRPNEYARGVALELKGYQHVAVCPTPPFKEEVEQARAMMKKLDDKYKDDPDFVVLRQLVFEHIYTASR